MNGLGAIVLAGGGAARLGGQNKPEIRVGGVRMIDRVLAALPGTGPVVVVGPPALALPEGVLRAREDPPGGGPVAAVAAAFGSGVLDPVPAVAIVGADLPLLDRAAITTLLAVLDRPSRPAADQPSRSAPDGGTGLRAVDGAVFVDADGRRQWLCGVWRTEAVRDRLHRLVTERGTADGASLRALFGPLAVAEVGHDGIGLPPFLDCDTEIDLKRVEEWLAR